MKASGSPARQRLNLQIGALSIGEPAGVELSVAGDGQAVRCIADRLGPARTRTRDFERDRSFRS
jgi:hypothetical protein